MASAHKSPAIYSSQNWGLPDGTWRLLFDRARSQFSSVHAVPTQVRDRGFLDDCHGATDRLGMGLVDSAAASILVNGAVDLSVAVTAIASNGDPLQSFQTPAQPLAPLVVQWSNHQDVELPIVATQQVSCQSRHIGAELGRSYLRLLREIIDTDADAPHLPSQRLASPRVGTDHGRDRGQQAEHQSSLRAKEAFGLVTYNPWVPHDVMRVLLAPATASIVPISTNRRVRSSDLPPWRVRSPFELASWEAASANQPRCREHAPGDTRLD